MTNAKRKLHNLRCFIRWNPNATASDYAKDRSEMKAQVVAIEKAYEASL